tara:strand:- start:3096 stop:5360 length:2265 start_codon:yes stop_codon:yes gene_type:complete
VAQIKKILFDKPNQSDISQYNFDENTDNFNYNNSTSLPENNDKFQNKDLFTNCVGNIINEGIIEKNLAFEGNSFIQIDNLFIKNTGVSGTTINNKVNIWIFSEKAYGGDPTQDGYSTVKDNMKDEWKFYYEKFDSQDENSEIGNVTAVEGIPIVSNFGVVSPSPALGDFPGIKWDIDDVTDDNGPFTLSSISEPDLLTTIFNQGEYNPIYIVIKTQGDKDQWWPINSDERKRKYSIFKINNEDLFQKSENDYQGSTFQTTFTSPTATKTGEGGSGATKSPWSVSSLKLTINTSAGGKNSFSDSSEYQNIIPSVLPKLTVNENIFNSFDWLLFLNPTLQLDNTQDPDYPNTILSKGFYRHPDFIPITTFGFSQNNQLGNTYVDLQSYYNDLNSIAKSSSPLNVTFNIDFKGIDGDDLKHYYSYDSYSELIDEEDDSDFPIGVVGDQLFYYFVIDWDDVEDKFKTLDDWLDSRPNNEFDYLEKQNQNLYKVKRINYTQGTNNGLLSNVYTTPGIKNVKFIMISIFDGNGQNNWSPDFEVGRWKLCTSRIYLDIPSNQYPDFSVVGGSDYTTLPWPYTTLIIGGVDKNSKYKISVQDTLSGGKIGNLDIIDEKLLINDIENDEMGKSVESMDLEQIRYFNTSYGMYDLLGIDAVINSELIQYNGFYYDGEVNKFSEESSVGQIFISDNMDLNLKQSCKLELNVGEVTAKSIVDSSGNSNKGLLMGDYKVKKIRKGEPMRRDSFIKVPKKTSNRKGAL